MYVQATATVLSMSKKYLSAIPPLTMVVAVVAKDSWNKKVVNTGPTAKPSAFTNLEMNFADETKRLHKK